MSKMTHLRERKASRSTLRKIELFVRTTQRERDVRLKTLATLAKERGHAR